MRVNLLRRLRVTPDDGAPAAKRGIGVECRRRRVHDKNILGTTCVARDGIARVYAR